ncbi:pilus assembly protein TadG-related protein [Streptomyces sp. NRRL S-237]|uniref:pilus assembly protein TadG-related protein n=1 Tax=Streptomyces sp. NRRL S-237 TaxID=1463895 RepID=UPI0004C7F1D7|nr:pilus assembly protein TadG-related protein [Streptomyces sp. NRRL S-237]
MTDRTGDRGQAFPVYVVVVAGLLFAALAFFAVGQAAVTRSDAQGAADAAALAAAREGRDHLLPGLDLAALTPKDWEDVLRGKRLELGGRPCDQAAAFAAKNDATAVCTGTALSFTVEAKTNGTVGRSVIPGTDTMQGTASATAVIEPRCRLGSLPAPTRSPGPADTGAGEPGKIEIQCRGGKKLGFDPLNPKPWSTLARTLFDVRLTD